MNILISESQLKLKVDKDVKRQVTEQQVNLDASKEVHMTMRTSFLGEHVQRDLEKHRMCTSWKVRFREKSSKIKNFHLLEALKLGSGTRTYPSPNTPVCSNIEGHLNQGIPAPCLVLTSNKETYKEGNQDTEVMRPPLIWKCIF